MSDWQTKASKIVYDNPWLTVYEDQVVMPSGREGIYGYVESKSDSVYIVPVDDHGNTYIIKQEHYTTKQSSWQCAAGRINGDTIETAAKRELLEETGLQANTITILSNVRIAVGMTCFRGVLCLARHLTKVTNELDPDEGIVVKKLPLTEVKDMIFAGEIINTESIAAFLMALTYLSEKSTKGA